jgi:twinfilin-like protein
LIQSIDVPTETIKLAGTDSNVSASSIASKISESSPRYSFYHYPGSDVVLFLYTCPSGSSIRERMLYASTRRGAIQLGEIEGVKVTKKVRRQSVSDKFMTLMIFRIQIEGSSPEEITEARLHEEVNPPQDEGPKKGFARPKRPGR